MDCTRVETEEIAERYLRKDLSQAEREAFESHFFECDRCFAEVRALESVQLELQRLGEGAVAPTPRVRSMPMWGWAAAALLVLATTAGVWLLTRTTAPGGGEVAENIPAARPPEPVSDPRGPTPEARLALGRIEAPSYVPLTVRSAGDLRRRFDAAMAEYAGGRYAAAAGGLEDVARMNPTAANAPFFLGICYLMLDRTDEAISAFQLALVSRDPSYGDEARFFLAKALVRKADLAGAERELDAVIRSDGPRAQEARALKAALASAGRR